MLGTKVLSASLLSTCLALVVMVAACAAFESGDAPAGNEEDAGGALPDASSIDPPDPVPDAGGGDDADACVVPVAQLSGDPKSGSAFCPYAGGSGALLGTGQNGNIDGENVNGCVRATFALDVSSVEIVAGLTDEACGVGCPACAGSVIGIYGVDDAAYTKVIELPVKEPPQSIPVTLPGAFRSVVVCRTNNVGKNIDVLTVAALGHCP